MPSHFFLDEKVTKKSRLMNICSVRLNKSLSANRSRGNGSGLTKFMHHSSECSGYCFHKVSTKDLLAFLSKYSKAGLAFSPCFGTLHNRFAKRKLNWNSEFQN
jgi:hypothetical protein